MHSRPKLTGKARCNSLLKIKETTTTTTTTTTKYKEARECSLCPHCQIMSNEVDAKMLSNVYFAEKLNVTCTEFTCHSLDFKSQQGNSQLFCSPFAANVENIPVGMYLIELQCKRITPSKGSSNPCMPGIDND